MVYMILVLVDSLIGGQKLQQRPLDAQPKQQKNWAEQQPPMIVNSSRDKQPKSCFPLNQYFLVI